VHDNVSGVRFVSSLLTWHSFGQCNVPVSLEAWVSLGNFVYPETSDAKSSLDSLFTVCICNVLGYQNMGMNTKSHFELYKAWSINGCVLKLCGKIEVTESLYSYTFD
jgi:hypothetical protein